MTNKISALIANAWNAIPSLPKISRENASLAAQAALKQLPWVVGTAVSFGLMTTTGLAAPGILFVGASFYKIFVIKSTSDDLSGKVDQFVLSILCFGSAAHFYYTAALLLNSSLTISSVSALFQRAFLGTWFFHNGMHVENSPPCLKKEAPGLMCNFDHFITKSLPTYDREFLFSQLNHCPLDIRRGSEIFLNLFERAHRYSFERMLKSEDPKDVAYIAERLKSPLTEAEIDNILKRDSALHPLMDFFHKFLQMAATVRLVRSIQISDKTPLGQKINELRRLHDMVLPFLDALILLGSGQVHDHLGRFDEAHRTSIGAALDNLGLTVGDYSSHFSSRQNLISKLHERGIYCLGDLFQAQIVGCNEKEKIIARLKEYLAGKSLKSIQNPSLPIHSKVAKVATAFFHLVLTGATLAAQFAFAPKLTGLGITLGFFLARNDINWLKNFRLNETGLFFPSSLAQKSRLIAQHLFSTIIALNTTTHLGKGFAFLAGVNQGERLSSYFIQMGRDL